MVVSGLVISIDNTLIFLKHSVDLLISPFLFWKYIRPWTLKLEVKFISSFSFFWLTTERMVKFPPYRFSFAAIFTETGCDKWKITHFSWNALNIEFSLQQWLVSFAVIKSSTNSFKFTSFSPWIKLEVSLQYTSWLATFLIFLHFWHFDWGIPK